MAAFVITALRSCLQILKPQFFCQQSNRHCIFTKFRVKPLLELNPKF
ncbi:MAG: hypothetical protein OFPI_02550 [Osedax symbiont Rs2]|nr:MAG: hypothetical protein OFPI_02550 [Osedax symbiont Rs2]